MCFKHVLLNTPRLVGVLFDTFRKYVSNFAAEMWDIIAIKCLYAEKQYLYATQGTVYNA